MAAPPDPPDADIWPDCSVLNESLQPWRREEREGEGKRRDEREGEGRRQTILNLREQEKYTGMRAESKAGSA